MVLRLRSEKIALWGGETISGVETNIERLLKCHVEQKES